MCSTFPHWPPLSFFFFFLDCSNIKRVNVFYNIVDPWGLGRLFKNYFQRKRNAPECKEAKREERSKQTQMLKTLKLTPLPHGHKVVLDSRVPNSPKTEIPNSLEYCRGFIFHENLQTLKGEVTHLYLSPWDEYHWDIWKSWSTKNNLTVDSLYMI